MQTLASHYGRDPLTVPAEIPTHALRHRLGRVHVATPPRDVLRIVRDGIAASPATFTRSQRRDTYRAALWLHNENRAEYAAVATGRL